LVVGEFIAQRVEVGLIFRARLIALVQQLDLRREHRSAWLRGRSGQHCPRSPDALIAAIDPRGVIVGSQVIDHQLQLPGVLSRRSTPHVVYARWQARIRRPGHQCARPVGGVQVPPARQHRRSCRCGRSTRTSTSAWARLRRPRCRSMAQPPAIHQGTVPDCSSLPTASMLNGSHRPSFDVTRSSCLVSPSRFMPMKHHRTMPGTRSMSGTPSSVLRTLARCRRRVGVVSRPQRVACRASTAGRRP